LTVHWSDITILSGGDTEYQVEVALSFNLKILFVVNFQKTLGKKSSYLWFAPAMIRTHNIVDACVDACECDRMHLMTHTL